MTRETFPVWTKKRIRPALVISGACLALSLGGCGGGSMFGSSTSSSAGGGSSFGDRFGQIFGSKSQAVGEAAAPEQPKGDEPTCPQVAVRYGASTLSVGLPGKQAAGADLRYQVSVLRTARDCTLSGTQIKARIGVQGRVLTGPAGAPPIVDVPLRVAVVQEVVPPKVLFSSAYRTSVEIPQDGSAADFSFVAEDIVYPVPADGGDKYIFYVGFDPSAVKPEAKPRGKRR